MPRTSYTLPASCDMRHWRSENGRRVYLGEPLCEGCDAPIADGPCGCVFQHSLTEEGR